MECRKQLCEKCKKKEDDYFLVTLQGHCCAMAFCIPTRLLLACGQRDCISLPPPRASLHAKKGIAAQWLFAFQRAFCAQAGNGIAYPFRRRGRPCLRKRALLRNGFLHSAAPFARKRATARRNAKRAAFCRPFSHAESEGFEPPEPRRVQQISSLPRSTTLATFRGKNTTFFAHGSPLFPFSIEKNSPYFH